MTQLQAVRGTKDYFFKEMQAMRRVFDTAARVASLYGFSEISTPIIEPVGVFKRSLGDSSDVVGKEMYIFQDKGGDEICLRPENTAAVVRAFIQNGLHQYIPCKFFYQGPMFRYERPQKGRYRQFHQIGAEVIGASEPIVDAEILAMAWRFLKALGLQDKVKLELNSLGDKESRFAYREALVAYFSLYKNDLSADSQNRLITNPLRILDSKDESDRKIITDAPQFKNYLNAESAQFLGKLCGYLDKADIKYELNQRMVRGLDYYCHTAFEFTTTHLGAQGTVLGGGRYDGLLELMGGGKIAGVGYAAGVERLALLCANDIADAKTDIVFCAMGEAAESIGLQITEDLREYFSVQLSMGNNLKNHLAFANKINAKFALIVGDNEIGKETVLVKDLDAFSQEEVAFYNIIKYLQQKITPNQKLIEK